MQSPWTSLFITNLLKVATSTITHLAMDLDLQKQQKYGGDKKLSKNDLSKTLHSPLLQKKQHHTHMHKRHYIISHSVGNTSVSIGLKVCLSKCHKLSNFFAR